MSTVRGLDKEDVVHLYSGILLSHKKNEICHRMNMDGSQGYYPKSEKDKYMVSLTCRIEKIQTYLQNRNRLRDFKNSVIKGETWGGRIN